MRYVSCRRLVLLGCLAATLCVLGIAQEKPRSGTIRIPYEFYVGPDKLPAGQYSIELISPSYAMLRSEDGKKQEDLYFMQIGEPAKNPEAKMVFATRNGKHLLAEVWGWFGGAQYTDFNAQPKDQMQSIPIQVKAGAKPPS